MFRWHPNEAHNGYLEIYLTLGLIGLFILAGILIHTFRKIRFELFRNFEWGRYRLGFLVAARSCTIGQKPSCKHFILSGGFSISSLWTYPRSRTYRRPGNHESGSGDQKGGANLLMRKRNSSGGQGVLFGMDIAVSYLKTIKYMEYLRKYRDLRLEAGRNSTARASTSFDARWEDCQSLHNHFRHLLLAAAGMAQGATINARSPSFTDVSTAIASAVKGDTVIVPAGTASWTVLLLSISLLR